MPCLYPNPLYMTGPLKTLYVQKHVLPLGSEYLNMEYKKSFGLKKYFASLCPHCKLYGTLNYPKKPGFNLYQRGIVPI